MKSGEAEVHPAQNQSVDNKLVVLDEAQNVKDIAKVLKVLYD